MSGSFELQFEVIRMIAKPLQRLVQFTHDAQERPGRILGDAKPLAQVDDRARQRTS